MGIPSAHFDFSWGAINNPFVTLSSIALDPADNTVWTGDDFINTVIKWDGSGNQLLTLDTNKNHDIHWLYLNPISRAIVTAANTQWQVQQWDTAGNFVQAVGSHGSSPGQFTTVTCCGILSDGTIYGGGNPNGIQRWASNGTFLGIWNPSCEQFTIAPDDTIWVQDGSTGLMKHCKPDGTVITSFPLCANGTAIPYPEQTGGSNYRLIAFSVPGPGLVGIFDQQLNQLASFGTVGTGDGQMNNIQSFTFGNGLIFLADEDNHRVDRWSYSNLSGTPNIAPIAGRGATW